jgi:response regulator RpfG family c-di-GMP phosphodiesterase
MIHERRGTVYDPAIVDAFLRILPRLRSAGEREAAARQARTRTSLRLQARAV